MILYYVRHGDPIYRPNQLTELGKLQAASVAKRLARYGVDQIYSSPSKRALQTAQPLCELVKKEAVLLDWTDEDIASQEFVVQYPDGRDSWMFLDPQMLRLFNSDEMRRLGRLWYTHPALAGTVYETAIGRVQREVDDFVESLGYRHDHEKNCYYEITPNDDRVALFAHAGFAAAFLSCLLDIPYPMFSARFFMTHSAVTIINFEPKNGIVIPELLAYSNDAHLYADGLPTKFQNEIYF